MADSELKVGMRGTWGDISVGILHVGEKKLFVRSAQSGEEYMIWPERFTPDPAPEPCLAWNGVTSCPLPFGHAGKCNPDPTPPSTVKVEILTHLVQQAATWADDDLIVHSGLTWEIGLACRAALRAEGLE